MELQNNVINDEYLFQKRMELLIDTNNKKVSGELNNLKNMISQLNNDIHELKKKINESQIEPIGEAVKLEERSEDIDDNKIKRIEKQKTTAKPRWGDYQPEDVSKKKFFYFGKKKTRKKKKKKKKNKRKR